MNRLSGLLQQAVLMSLIKKMKEAGSWCGETHIQKSAYFLRALLEVPIEYQFVLYKHGPYSFELHDELVGMTAYGLIRVDSQLPYGPSISITERSEDIMRRFPKTLDELSQQIVFVAKALGGERVSSLEQLATALYVTFEASSPKDRKKRALTLNELKPHVSLEAAEAAIERVDKLIEQVTKEGLRVLE